MSLQEFNIGISIAVVILGFIGQGAFCIIFATRDWTSNQLTKAMMNKSFSLFLLFFLSLSRLIVRGPRRGIEDPLWFIICTLIVSLYILFSIWYQLIALIREVYRGKRVPFLHSQKAGQ